MSILKHNTKLGCCTVISNDILKIGRIISGDIIFPKFIVVEGSDILDMTAIDLHNIQKLQNELGENKNSWHFSVDDKNIVQSVDSYWLTLNASTFIENKEIISIKICQFKDENRTKLAEDNAITLILELSKIHILDINNCVKRLKDYSKEFAPYSIFSQENNWNDFFNRILNYNFHNETKYNSDNNIFNNENPNNPISSTNYTIIDEKKYITNKKILLKYFGLSVAGFSLWFFSSSISSYKIDFSSITIFLFFGFLIVPMLMLSMGLYIIIKYISPKKILLFKLLVVMHLI